MNFHLKLNMRTIVVIQKNYEIFQNIKNIALFKKLLKVSR